MTSEYEAAVVELAERIMALCTDEKNDVDVVLDARTHALLTVCEDKRNTELVSGDILPLKPPAATHDHAVRSFTRAAIATGLAAIDRGIRHGCG
jgi:hypothetical protein